MAITGRDPIEKKEEDPRISLEDSKKILEGVMALKPKKISFAEALYKVLKSCVIYKDYDKNHETATFNALSSGLSVCGSYHDTAQRFDKDFNDFFDASLDDKTSLDAFLKSRCDRIWGKFATKKEEFVAFTFICWAMYSDLTTNLLIKSNVIASTENPMDPQFRENYLNLLNKYLNPLLNAWLKKHNSQSFYETFCKTFQASDREIVSKVRTGLLFFGAAVAGTVGYLCYSAGKSPAPKP